MTKPLLVLVFLINSLAPVFPQDTKTKSVDSVGIQQADYFMGMLRKHYSEGKYQLFKAYGDSLLQVAKKHDLPKMHVYALVNQAIFYNNRNSRLRAIELYHEALEECKRIPEDFRTRTVVLVNMGNTYNNIGSYDKAIATMEEVLVVADSTENSDMVKAAALIGLSNNYMKLEKFEKALKYAELTKEIGENTENGIILASSINSIMDAQIGLEAYEEALPIGQDAMKLPIMEKPTKNRGGLLLNLGIVNYYLENYEKALQYLMDCASLAEEKELFEIEMHAQEYLAKTYEQKKDFKASYAAQKKYSELRDEHLIDKRDASTTDLKKDIVSKDETIIKNKEELLAVSNKGKQFVIWGVVLLVVLISLLFLYIKRKKEIEREQENLRVQYTNLQKSVQLKEGTSEEKVVQSLGKSKLSPYKNSSLTPEKREEFKEKILAFIDIEKPFLNPDLNQSDLASKMGISSHHLSEVLHYGFEQNFYNFINSYRVMEAQKLIKDENYKDAKIIAIAFDSGFKSKTSFNRVFKKHTGLTPSEYRAKA